MGRGVHAISKIVADPSSIHIKKVNICSNMGIILIDI